MPSWVKLSVASFHDEGISLGRRVKTVRFVVSYIGALIDFVRSSDSFISVSLQVSFEIEVFAMFPPGSVVRTHAGD